MSASEPSLSETLRLPPGPVDLAEHDPRATPGFTGDKAAGKEALASLGAPLSELQEQLWAHGLSDGHRRVLLVLQGMDTSGKGGVIRHTVGLFDPQGVRIKSFKAPTAAERRHDFLWRVEREVPGPGLIGIFDRSHYEDVRIARVHGLAEPNEIERRYDAINDFEQRLVDDDKVTVVKCMLHLSRDTQKERLLERLDDPEKHYKFNPGDIDERKWWPDYRAAYEVALERCNTTAAPWHVVPADRKWYRNWAIATVLHEALGGLGLTWPMADFDVAVERERLLAT